MENRRFGNLEYKQFSEEEHNELKKIMVRSNMILDRNLSLVKSAYREKYGKGKKINRGEFRNILNSQLNNEKVYAYGIEVKKEDAIEICKTLAIQERVLQGMLYAVNIVVWKWSSNGNSHYGNRQDVFQELCQAVLEGVCFFNRIDKDISHYFGWVIYNRVKSITRRKNSLLRISSRDFKLVQHYKKIAHETSHDEAMKQFSEKEQERIKTILQCEVTQFTSYNSSEDAPDCDIVNSKSLSCQHTVYSAVARTSRGVIYKKIEKVDPTDWKTIISKISFTMREKETFLVYLREEGKHGWMTRAAEVVAGGSLTSQTIKHIFDGLMVKINTTIKNEQR